MNLAPPDLASFQYILRNLRPRDRTELEAVDWTFDPDDAAPRALQAWRSHGVFGQVVSLDEPIALLVLTWSTPTSAQASLLATERWPEIVSPLARHCLRKIKPLVIGRGVRRIECRTWDQHTDARRFLEWFGAREECRIPHWGKSGETFVQYGWTADVHQPAQGHLDAAADRDRYDAGAE